MYRTGCARHWWVQALMGVAGIAAAASVVGEPQLLGIIKIVMTLLFGTGGLWLLAESVATLRTSRSADGPDA